MLRVVSAVVFALLVVAFAGNSVYAQVIIIMVFTMQMMVSGIDAFCVRLCVTIRRLLRTLITVRRRVFTLTVSVVVLWVV